MAVRVRATMASPRSVANGGQCGPQFNNGQPDQVGFGPAVADDGHSGEAGDRIEVDPLAKLGQRKALAAWQDQWNCDRGSLRISHGEGPLFAVVRAGGVLPTPRRSVRDCSGGNLLLARTHERVNSC